MRNCSFFWLLQDLFLKNRIKKAETKAFYIQIRYHKTNSKLLTQVLLQEIDFLKRIEFWNPFFDMASGQKKRLRKDEKRMQLIFPKLLGFVTMEEMKKHQYNAIHCR